MRITKQIEIKGNFVKRRNNFVYKDERIIFKRKGSFVETKGNEVFIHADVLGMDKIYYEIKQNKISISNIFKDFLSNKINNDFIGIQKHRGYVPYPFTLLKNVRKAPPGIITKLEIKDTEVICSYEASDDLKMFSRSNKFAKKNFRREFDALLKENFTGKCLISSFSGGFDSLFLTKIYEDKCKYILHFSEDDKVSVEHYKSIFPNRKWIIINNEQAFTEKDRRKYFESADEPCCDPSGFAEFMMVKEVAKNKKARNYPIMNGQSCDGIFTNGRKYYREYTSSKLLQRFNKINISDEKRQKYKVLSRIHNYTRDTKERFYQFYLDEYKFPTKINSEMDNLYKIYEQAIKNDSTNFLAAVIIILKYSIYEIEKIKTAARAFNTRYYLPFMSNNLMTYAFSIPARNKVGFKIGKKILIKAYPEISEMKFISRDFVPQALKEKLIGEKMTEKNYKRYYIEQWLKYSRA